MDKKSQFNLGYFLAAIWLMFLLQYFWGYSATQTTVTYRQFEQFLQQDAVKSIVIDDEFIRGEFKEPMDGKKYFLTPRIEVELAEKLAQYDVDYAGTFDSRIVSAVLSWVAPAAVFILVWYFLFRKFAERQGLGGMMSIGKSKAKVLMERHTGVSFDDVAGVDEAKDELVEIVNFLRAPQQYSRLGAHIPKGVLLVGPPGTGKTLIARAVAGEAGVPFFSISGSEFIELFVGVGAARVRDLFAQAKDHAPAIVFIDELDALGRARAAGPYSGGHDEREQTLNQLLTELDGFNPSEGVIILGATNRPEILDPALLRAGRFDRQVLVDRPDKRGREQILRVHLRKIKGDASVDAGVLASLTTGFSGADLANLVNEAALLATRRNAEAVSMNDCVSAIERIVAGLQKKSRLTDPNEKRVVAYHEMGHALVAMELSPDQPVQKVTIIPRGIGALGYTLQRPTDDRYLMSKTDLRKRIAVLLAGRAAELLVFHEVTTGATDDLAKATDIARAMVTQYGMSDELGLLTLESYKPQFLEQNLRSGREIGPAMERKVTLAIRRILADAFAQATNILSQNRSLLESAAEQLIKDETLDDSALSHIRSQLKR